MKKKIIFVLVIIVIIIGFINTPRNNFCPFFCYCSFYG